MMNEVVAQLRYHERKPSAGDIIKPDIGAKACGGPPRFPNLARIAYQECLVRSQAFTSSA